MIVNGTQDKAVRRLWRAMTLMQTPKYSGEELSRVTDQIYTYGPHGHPPVGGDPAQGKQPEYITAADPHALLLQPSIQKTNFFVHTGIQKGLEACREVFSFGLFSFIDLFKSYFYTNYLKWTGLLLSTTNWNSPAAVPCVSSTTLSYLCCTNPKPHLQKVSAYQTVQRQRQCQLALGLAGNRQGNVSGRWSFIGIFLKNFGGLSWNNFPPPAQNRSRKQPCSVPIPQDRQHTEP